MSYTLETTVEAIITRLLLLEQAGIADQSPAPVGATKHWYYFPQSFPYWTNRPAGIRHNEPQHKWRVDIQARLWLAHKSQANAQANEIQTDVWSYIPAFLAYMQDHRQLNLTGQANINYLDAPGATTDNLVGLETGIMPLVTGEWLFTDFTIQVPILIYEVT